MTDHRPLNSEPTKSDTLGSPEYVERAGNATVQTVVAQSNRSERRRLIRAAVASVPVVLTFTAGKARAMEGSPKDSSITSPAANELELDDTSKDSKSPESEDGELTPAEKLETFGLQRAERPEGYSEDPFRDLDAMSEPVDLNNP